jgi:Xaa-Pro dipeptidase
MEGNMGNPRIDQLVNQIGTQGYAAIALNPGPTLRYLTGMEFHLMERPVVLFIHREGKHALVLPELEQGKADQFFPEVSCFPYTDDPETWKDAFISSGKSLNLGEDTIGVEPNRFRFLEASYLQEAIPGCKLVSAEEVLSGIRLRKDDGEIQLMRKAVEIAQTGLRNTIPSIRTGITEREIAAELVSQLLKAGSDGELPFQPIVSAGENGANPHATPTDRKLRTRDLAVIDWGAAYHGYFSDLTRTLAMGNADAELEAIYRIVQAANEAGRAAGKAGNPAGNVDAAARKVIVDSGYGSFFTHRTGHGLGMEAHEPPYLFAGNPMILEKSMTYTVEPGIYIPGKGGVRIEDNMVMMDDFAESLSDMDRNLIRL